MAGDELNSDDDSDEESDDEDDDDDPDNFEDKTAKSIPRGGGLPYETDGDARRKF